MKKNIAKRVLSCIFLASLMAFAVFASLTASVSKLDYSIPDDIPDEEKTDSISLTNSFTDNSTISDFIFEFAPDTSAPENDIVTGNFIIDDFSTGFSLTPSMSTKQITVKFDVPQGLPAIDEEDEKLEEKVWDVGKLKITGTKNGSSAGPVFVEIPVTIEVKNNLKFYNNKVEIEIGDAEPKNVSDGSTERPAVNEDVTINVRYHNTYNKNNDGFTFTGSNIEAKLFAEDDEVDAAEGEDDVEDGEIGLASLSLDLGDYEADDKIDIKIELKGTDNFGSLHGEIFEFKLELQEEADVQDEEDSLDTDGDGINDGIDLCPNTQPGCIVEFDGCKIDFDGDGIEDCTGSFNNNKKNNDETEDSQQKNINVVNNKKSETKNEEAKPQTKTTPVAKESASDSGATSFIFGLVIGVVGTALFFILTRV